MRNNGIVVFGILLLTLCAEFSYAQVDTSFEKVRDSLLVYSAEIPSLLETADINISGVPLPEFIRAIAETHDLNVSLRGIPSARVQNNFTNVRVADLLAYLITENDLEFQVYNNIIILFRQQLPEKIELTYDSQSQLLNLQLESNTLATVAREITRLSAFNVLVDQPIRSKQVSGYIQQLPVEIALKQLAETNGLQVEQRDENVLLLKEKEIVQPQSANTSNLRRRSGTNRGGGGFRMNVRGVGDSASVSLEATDAAINDLLQQAGKQANRDYILLNDLEGQVTCRLVNVPFEDFLTIMLASTSTPSSFSTTGDVYVIGNSDNKKLDQSSLHVFKYRSVEALQETLPKSFTEVLEIVEFPELNALMLSGSEQEIERLKSFLEEIDRPVANVLIEVMVVEINQGNTISTGITAGLADSTISTGGTVFPGIDFTLSSNSLNDFLEKIDRRGVINLGKVTPDFYVTLEALESNNFLDLKSTPKLSTVNGNEAELTIGRSVYYLIETQNVTGGVNPIVTVTPRYEKVEANLKIKIKPFVSEFKKVTLSVEAEFSDFIEPTVQGAPPGNATRQFLSKISVDNEEMIVLGGLEEESKSSTGRGVPVLGRLPVLKWIFNGRTETDTNNKLIIFIRPSVTY